MPPLPAADLDLILGETLQLWDQMRGQRLFLTGGTGFFGCWLVESFLHANRELQLDAHVTILTRSPEAFASKAPHLAHDPALSLLTGDVRSFAFPPGDYAYVIHAATDASARQLAEQPLTMLSTILEGTARTLDFAATHGTRKLLLTSSGAIYGPQPASLTHIPESYLGAPNPLDPGSTYAEGKRAAELMAAVYSRTTELEVKVARCFALLGPHLPLDAHFAIGNFIGDALAGRPIRIAGDGTALRSYLYGADLAIWLWTMLFRAPSMRAFNVGSPHAFTIRQLAELVAQTIAPGTQIEIAQPPSGLPPHRYIPDTARAEAELNLRQHIPLDQAIHRTATWYGLESQRQK